MTKKRSKQLLVFAMLALAIFARVWLFGNVPASTYWDETAILLDARAIATTGDDWLGNTWLQAIFPSYGDFKLPVYIWFTSVAVKIFGAKMWVVRLPSLVAGLASILIVFLLGTEINAWFKLRFKDMFWLKWSLLLITAVSYWGIHFSHVGFEGHLGQALLSLGLLFSIKFIRQKNLYALLTFAVAFFLAILTYYSVRFVLIGLVGWFAFWFLFWRTAPKKVAFWTIFVLILSAIAINWQSSSPHWQASEQIRLSTDSVLSSTTPVERTNYLRAQFNFDLLSRVQYHRYWFKLVEFGRHLSTYLTLDYLYLTGDHNLRHGTSNHGLFPVWLAPIFLFGLIFLLARKPKLAIFLVGWWLIALLPAAVPNDVPHALRSLNAWMPLILLHAFALANLLEVIDDLRGRSSFIKYMLVGLISILSVLSLGQFLYFYRNQYSSDSASDWHVGYARLAEVATANQDTYERVWVQPFDGRWFLWLALANPEYAEQAKILDHFHLKSLNKIFIRTPSCQEFNIEEDSLIAEIYLIDNFRENCDLWKLPVSPITVINQTPFASLGRRK